MKKDPGGGLLAEHAATKFDHPQNLQQANNAAVTLMMASAGGVPTASSGASTPFGNSSGSMLKPLLLAGLPGAMGGAGAPDFSNGMNFNNGVPIGSGVSGISTPVASSGPYPQYSSTGPMSSSVPMPQSPFAQAASLAAANAGIASPAPMFQPALPSGASSQFNFGSQVQGPVTMANMASVTAQAGTPLQLNFSTRDAFGNINGCFSLNINLTPSCTNCGSQVASTAAQNSAASGGFGANTRGYTSTATRRLRQVTQKDTPPRSPLAATRSTSSRLAAAAAADGATSYSAPATPTHGQSPAKPPRTGMSRSSTASPVPADALDESAAMALDSRELAAGLRKSVARSKATEESENEDAAEEDAEDGQDEDEDDNQEDEEDEQEDEEAGEDDEEKAAEDDEEDGGGVRKRSRLAYEDDERDLDFGSGRRPRSARRAASLLAAAMAAGASQGTDSAEEAEDGGSASATPSNKDRSGPYRHGVKAAPFTLQKLSVTLPEEMVNQIALLNSQLSEFISPVGDQSALKARNPDKIGCILAIFDALTEEEKLEYANAQWWRTSDAYFKHHQIATQPSKYLQSYSKTHRHLMDLWMQKYFGDCSVKLAFLRVFDVAKRVYDTKYARS
ncbi:hypothetical protein CAOG_02778 [Capsaspora owczarzaki ATCC 30864]|uniref:Uncharacterized protein n=1 Tax=Capsaspora owczarzaki (strain ATCC 30864) TaxID=595528 RepID=A0A0D2WN13_CAPO3|nr:hypothetical protein CAOG_02778 [Capsaspora owczarzaki ATCC 30864]KJE91673.1 hypothetical protein CAOG_002778 [Capsaspora owczarzaki ATCC 30864]KJE91674.1 hypothetical protein, variant [Capsaspora owczarzaki ATCC 30864]|eukprot:XP_004349531.2 hypothetical protein CAOG_02778 [Capsaspora owczarzaki ATCC 30864]